MFKYLLSYWESRSAPDIISNKLTPNKLDSNEFVSNEFVSNELVPTTPSIIPVPPPRPEPYVFKPIEPKKYIDDYFNEPSLKQQYDEIDEIDEIEKNTFLNDSKEIKTESDILEMTNGHPWCIDQGILWGYNVETATWFEAAELFMSYEGISTNEDDWHRFEGDSVEALDFIGFEGECTHMITYEEYVPLLDDAAQWNDNEIYEEPNFNEAQNEPNFNEANFNEAQNKTNFNEAHNEEITSSDDEYYQLINVESESLRDESFEDKNDESFEDESLKSESLGDENDESLMDDDDETESLSESEQSEKNEQNEQSENDVFALYEKWVLSNDEPCVKMGIKTDSPALWELVHQYNINLDELYGAEYCSEIMFQQIEDEIDYCFNELIIDFVLDLFENCNYRYQDTDNIVCNKEGETICTFNEFIDRYLNVLDRSEYKDYITNRIKGSSRLPYTAKLIKLKYE